VLRFRWETEFKETEIGEIPKEWEVKKATEYIDFIRGIEPGSKLYKNSGKYRFIRVGNLSGERESEVFIDIEVDNEKIANKNDILISFDGTVGIVRKGLEGVFSSGIRKIKIKQEKMQELNYEFLYWFFKSTLKHQIFGFSDEKTTLAHASDSIPYLKILLPPLPEQSRIATVLSWFDDLIEVKKRQNEILEKTAMAIFKSWFIDFEPFRDGEFVYSEELGKEIPKGWEVDKTTRLIDYNPPVSIEEGKVFPFVEMKDVSTNSLACDFSFKTFTGSGVKYFGGDTLMARITPSLEHGKTAFVWFISEKEKGFGSTEFFVLHPKKSYLKGFVYLLAKSNDFREVAINSMSGTSGRQRADINALKNYLIPIPPSHILQSFHSLVEPLFQKIILNQKQIMTLRKIRDTLLPLLVFGKLRVEEV
jgi:type I restriction enzyme S subunit